MVIFYSYVKLPESALGSADFKHQTLAGQGAHPNDLPWRTAGYRTPEFSDAKDVKKNI
jgi:hypothetical protein